LFWVFDYLDHPCHRPIKELLAVVIQCVDALREPGDEGAYVFLDLPVSEAFSHLAVVFHGIELVISCDEDVVGVVVAYLYRFAVVLIDLVLVERFKSLECPKDSAELVVL